MISIDMIQEMIGTCLQVALKFWLMCLVLKNRQKKTGISYWLVLGVTAVCCVAASLLLPEILSQINVGVNAGFVYITVFCILTVVPCGMLYRATAAELVFLYFILQSYIDNCFLISKVMQGIYQNAFLQQPVSYMVLELLLFAVTLPAVLWFVKYRLRVLMDTTQGMDFWKYVWLLPVAFYIVYRLGISQEYNMLAQMWEYESVIVTTSWIVGMLLGYIIVVETLIDTVRTVEERERLETVNQQLLMQQEQYRLIQQTIDETKRVRHDLHHQILDLKAFVDRDDMEGIRKYLYAHLEGLHLSEPALYCRNYAVNTIIQYYVDLARKDGIFVLVNLEISEDLPCSSSDLTVIFGRLLDHAVEISRKKTGGKCFIELKSRMQGNDILVVHVKTSGGYVINAGVDSAYGSHFKMVHHKMASVASIAEKYHGVTRLEQEAGEFQGYVLLNRGGGVEGKTWDEKQKDDHDIRRERWI